MPKICPSEATPGSHSLDSESAQSSLTGPGHANRTRPVTHIRVDLTRLESTCSCCFASCNWLGIFNGDPSKELLEISAFQLVLFS